MLIISVGGSLLVPHDIDTIYLSKLLAFLKGKHAVVVVGGGNIARTYQQAAPQSPQDRDWIGIRATHLNAELLRAHLGDAAYEKVLHEPEKVETNKIIVAGGWKPGWSTDYVAAKFAEIYEAQTIINLTNTKGVFTKDPKEEGAELIPKMSWQEFEQQFGKEWSPGLHAPFDPIAAQLAKKLQKKVIVCDGHDVENLEKVMQGESFEGTIIE